MNEAKKNKFAESLGITSETKAVLDIGSDHNYLCTCETCRKWWQEMGPDGITYGPFKAEQIEDGTKLGDVCKSIRLQNLADGNY